MGGKWLYRCCFLGCYFYDLFKIVHNFFSKRFVQVEQPYSSTNTVTAWKNSHFILSEREKERERERADFHMVDKLSIAVDALLQILHVRQ